MAGRSLRICARGCSFNVLRGAQSRDVDSNPVHSDPVSGVYGRNSRQHSPIVAPQAPLVSGVRAQRYGAGFRKAEPTQIGAASLIILLTALSLGYPFT